MKRILLVENDVFLLTTLINTLSIEGRVINTARSLNDSFVLMKKNHYDLLISDRVMDDGDGIELVKYLHERSFTTRTLLLTKKNRSDEIVEGLRVGADDYLSKPFSLAELSLRVKKLLRV